MTDLFFRSLEDLKNRIQIQSSLGGELFLCKRMEICYNKKRDDTKREVLNMAKDERNAYTIQNDASLGEVKIADEVVAIIAALAATEVDGVASMAGNITNEVIGTNESIPTIIKLLILFIMSIFNSLQSLLAQTPEVPAPEEIAQTWQQKLSALSSLSFQQFMEQAISAILHGAVKIAIALAVFFIGKWIINRIYHFISKAFIRRNVELSLRTFLLSLIRIILMLILIVIVIGILGINTSSFLAIFASAGLAIGMALSGTLQNFAGGVMILLFKPYKVGDFIEAQGYSGTVKEIQIFNTILNTPDNKTIIIPNGGLSTGSLNNYSKEGRRRVDWKIGIAYGDDFDTARKAILELLAADKRVFDDPAPFVVLSSLADSAIEITVRVWTASENYWGVFFDFNEQVYKQFDKYGLHFPYPQVDVHMIQDNQ